jgi:hypothetical protein
VNGLDGLKFLDYCAGAARRQDAFGLRHIFVYKRRGVPEWDFMQKRFFSAMAAYGALALMAAVTLDGKFRIGVWIFLAGLAVKTLIHYKTSNL